MDIVINFSKCTTTSITASNRIALWIADKFNCTLIDDVHSATYCLSKNIDKAIIVNGMFQFCNFREEVVQLCRKAKKIVWIGNDYAIAIPSQLKEVKLQDNFYRVAQYSNFDGVKNHQLVDFNKLTFQPNVKYNKPKHKGLFYFGALRDDRIPKFFHYLKKNNELQITVSSSSKNVKEFKKLLGSISFVTPIHDIIHSIRYFESSIYIEDVIKKDIKLTPANRFYECLSSRILLFYDIDSKRTLENAGFWNDELCVSSQEDIIQKLKDYNYFQELQQRLFNNGDRNYKEELETEFTIALQKI